MDRWRHDQVVVFASSYGALGRKDLGADCRGNWVVTENGKTVYRGKKWATAMSRYNDIEK